jgi:hypothetical protein
MARLADRIFSFVSFRVGFGRTKGFLMQQILFLIFVQLKSTVLGSTF